MGQPPTRPDRPQLPTAVERPNNTPRLDDGRRTATMPGAAEQPAASSDNTDSLIGVAVGDGYVIRNYITEGGMGALYVAAHRDAPTKRKAIKVLLPSLLAKCSPRTRDDIWHRFETEARIALRLEHPNVIVVDGYDRLPTGPIYIKMEFLEGKNLGQWARDRHGGIVPADDVLRVMAQVCGALEQAHKMGVVHRDLKPPNIFVVATDDGSIKTKLLDFGIARVIDPHALPGGKKTTLPRAMGTPGYWAPEQQTSPGEVDHRADIYAIGVIIYELTTNQLPGFGSLVPHQLPPTFPREWYDGIAAALAGDPRQRPQSIRDLLNFLIDRTPNGPQIAHEACPSLYKVPVAWSDSTTRAPLSGVGSVHNVTPPPPLPPSTLTHAAGAYGTQLGPRRGRSLLLAALAGAAVTAAVAIGVVVSLQGSSSTPASSSTTNAPGASSPASTSPPAASSATSPPATSSPAAVAAPAGPASTSPPPDAAAAPATIDAPPAAPPDTTAAAATSPNSSPSASPDGSTAEARDNAPTKRTPKTTRTTRKPPRRTTVERLGD